MTWAAIPGHPGYEVSDQGHVRSWVPWREKPLPHVLALSPDVYGYHCVGLRAPGRVTTLRVHALVALVFIGPRPAGFEVRHLDGDKVNNCSTNLAYGTKGENQRDAVRHGTHPWARKTHCPQGHPYSAENTYLTPKTGARSCRICKRDAASRSYQRRKAAA